MTRGTGVVLAAAPPDRLPAAPQAVEATAVRRGVEGREPPAAVEPHGPNCGEAARAAVPRRAAAPTAGANDTAAAEADD